MLIKPITKNLHDLAALLQSLPDAEYAKSCPELSGSSIGAHTRHIIEMFESLVEQYDTGIVNYDDRKRNIMIENSTEYALSRLNRVVEQLQREDKKIILQQSIDGVDIEIESNYNRELLYNLEHCIHHQALIKVALYKSGINKVDAHFGVAPSTIAYRKQCAP